MCCTPIGRENRYLEELRFPLFASIFFKSLYPSAKIFLATTQDAKVPDHLNDFFQILRYPFEREPFAISRMHFYLDFINSKHFSEDTILSGTDVLILKRINLPISDHGLAITYRYHKSMPYCSDWIFINKKNSDLVSNLILNVYSIMQWMPREIQSSWADQLSLAIEMGFLNDDQYDNKIHTSTKNDRILLLPANEFLFTPNDYFSSIKGAVNGQLTDTPDLDTLLTHSLSKTAIHFKGNRKNLFIALAYLFKKNNRIDFNSINLGFSDDFLFKEYYQIIEN